MNDTLGFLCYSALLLCIGCLGGFILCKLTTPKPHVWKWQRHPSMPHYDDYTQQDPSV